MRLAIFFIAEIYHRPRYGLAAVLVFFYLTDFTLPLLSQQKNGIMRITKFFKKADCMGVYVRFACE
jgi:biotin transporter BioY